MANKLFKNGNSSRGLGTRGQQPYSDNRSRAQKEKEELDYAIAHSLSEDFKKPNGYRWQTNNDDDPARTLHVGPRAALSSPYAPSDYYPQSHRICAGCKREIGYGDFHPACFRCCKCGNLIPENDAALSGRDKYHKSCFKWVNCPKCEVCQQRIPINKAGRMENICHPFWSQKYCPWHEYDNTARCCSCERLEQWYTQYMPLGDGRSICFECQESAIIDTGDCQPLYHAIRDYYEGMNMRIDQQFPLLLVERQTLNKAIEGEKHCFHHGHNVRSLCTSEEQNVVGVCFSEETVTSILERSRVPSRGLFGIRTQPQRLVRSCKVTAILVLYGLPRLMTGAIIAHELMHAWLRLQGYGQLKPEVEEGICHVIAHMWLKSEVIPLASSMDPSSSTSKKGGKSAVQKKLGEFFMHQIAHDPSPEYGGGYRAAMAAVNKYGLRPTLDHIRLTGDLPWTATDSLEIFPTII